MCYPSLAPISSCLDHRPLIKLRCCLMRPWCHILMSQNVVIGCAITCCVLSGTLLCISHCCCARCYAHRVVIVHVVVHTILLLCTLLCILCHCCACCARYYVSCSTLLCCMKPLMPSQVLLFSHHLGCTHCNCIILCLVSPSRFSWMHHACP